MKIKSQWWKWGVIVIALGIGLSLIWLALNFLLIRSAIRNTDLKQASYAADRAEPVLHFYSSLTLHQIPDLEIGRLGLILLSQAPATWSQSLASLDETTSSPAQQAEQPTLKTILTPTLINFQHLVNLLPRSFLVTHWLSQATLTQLQTVSPLIPLFQSTILNGDQTWVILFQNNQELRATGGFMGSLAFVTLHEGSITKIDIQDIYQPDGQFTGLVEAPPGVKEYLSGGKGWRLPDMNWSPDLPSSAQQILEFLNQTNQPNLKGVITVNESLVEKILAAIGDVYVPDAQTNISADNIASVLRQNRDQFFPGSIAKQHLLASFFTQFKIKIQQSDTQTQLSLMPLLLQAVSQKNIQFYATDSNLEKVILDHEAGGQLPNAPAADLYLFPIESNVGINKANQGVTRKWDMTIQPTQTTLSITFFNTNTHPTDIASNSAEAKHLHYVNYQRVLIKPDMQVIAIKYNQVPITNWDENVMTDSRGDQLKQIGFLVTVPEQSTGTLEIELNHPSLPTSPTLVIGKQSGIDPVPLKLHYQNQDFSQTLTTDLTWKLP